MTPLTARWTPLARVLLADAICTGHGVTPAPNRPRIQGCTRHRSHRARGLCGLGTTLLALNILAADAQQQLSTQLNQFLSAPRFAHATWGIDVQEAESHRVWFATNQHRTFIPASNAKLFTAALVLDQLGGDHRFETELLAHARPDRSGTLKGPLVVRGKGDFSWSARFHDGNPEAALDPLIRAIQQTGLHRIDGDLVADCTWFRGPPWGQGWAWDDLQHPIGAEVSALCVHDNSLSLLLTPGQRPGAPCQITPSPFITYVSFKNHLITGPQNSPPRFTVYRAPGQLEVWLFGQIPPNGSGQIANVSVPNPTRWFLELLRDRLAREGIKVRGRLRVVERPAQDPSDQELAALQPIGRLFSPPLRELITPMMKDSQNLHAQSLLQQMGAFQPSANTAQPAASPQITTDRALNALRTFATRANIPSPELQLRDGAGLSRQSRVSPAAVVQLLQFMASHPEHHAFWDSLPIAGVDGTLRLRFQQTPAHGILRAKTGTLSDVQALSGAVANRAGSRLLFSILLNGFTPDENTTAPPPVDLVALIITRAWETESP
jgi:serine-type D-Ala-D-Ala carboxypeptidase/endopeptidase (penicillin-binding protein 4)